jgi:hypothetical protein
VSSQEERVRTLSNTEGPPHEDIRDNGAYTKPRLPKPDLRLPASRTVKIKVCD